MRLALGFEARIFGDLAGALLFLDEQFTQLVGDGALVNVGDGAHPFRAKPVAPPKIALSMGVPLHCSGSLEDGHGAH
jgi:hypothetical protein